jgi:hypothetical protein
MEKQSLNNIEAIFSEVYEEELLQCNVGCKIKLWTKIDTDLINAYRQGTIGGGGKVAVLSKSENQEITNLMHTGHPVWLIVTERNGDKFSFTINTDRNKIRAL